MDGMLVRRSAKRRVGPGQQGIARWEQRAGDCRKEGADRRPIAATITPRPYSFAWPGRPSQNSTGGTEAAAEGQQLPSRRDGFVVDDDLLDHTGVQSDNRQQGGDPHTIVGAEPKPPDVQELEDKEQLRAPTQRELQRGTLAGQQLAQSGRARGAVPPDHQRPERARNDGVYAAPAESTVKRHGAHQTVGLYTRLLLSRSLQPAINRILPSYAAINRNLSSRSPPRLQGMGLPHGPSDPRQDKCLGRLAFRDSGQGFVHLAERVFA